MQKLSRSAQRPETRTLTLTPTPWPHPFPSPRPNPSQAPLHTAARLPATHAPGLVRLLVGARADVDGTDQFGQTALHVAAAAAAAEAEEEQEQGGGAGAGAADAAAAMEALLACGADATRKNGAGRTAAEVGGPGIARLLAVACDS